MLGKIRQERKERRKKEFSFALYKTLIPIGIHNTSKKTIAILREKTQKEDKSSTFSLTHQLTGHVNKSESAMLYAVKRKSNQGF